jgi:hypothetical protein
MFPTKQLPGEYNQATSIERLETVREGIEIKRDRAKFGSSCQITPPFPAATNLCSAGDLDHERSTMVSLVQPDGPLYGGLSDKVGFSAAPVANGSLPADKAA